MEDTAVEAPPDLDEIPVLADYEDDPPASPTGLAASSPGLRVSVGPAEGFGRYPREQLAARLGTGSVALEWAQVAELRRRASEVITEESERSQQTTGRPLAGDDRLLLGRSVIRRVVGDHVRALHRDGAELWSSEAEQTYVAAVEDSVFGYGRLQPLLEMPTVENIEIHGWDSVFVQYGDGRRERMPPVADSDEELVEAIRFLGQNSQPARPFDDTHPSMTLALGERFRLHAIGFGLSYRPSVVIRQHTLTDVSLADLAAGGLMPVEVAEFLDAAILARRSMVISGDQGAGKTTLLRALINAIPAHERFGTLETDYELMTHLQPGRENILALQARTGHGETSGGTRVGEVTISDLMPEALRQNLSRLVVGEVRGGEAAAMFEAMQAAPVWQTIPMRVGVYTRISKDSTGQGAGVARQEQDCRAKAEANGWTVARVYSDNDTSAYSGTPRPGYRALLSDIKAGNLDAVLVWHVDRLYRRTTELEEFIALCQPRNIPTHTVQSGPLDLATPSGRMVARTLGSVSQYESEQKAERQRRANRQRAEAGRHFGTRRPFGFELDGITVRPAEAEAVRSACADVLAGKSLAGISRDWNARGLVTPQAGNPWTATVLRRTLTTERLAGIKTYRGEVVRDSDGEPIRAAWPALVDLETWQAVQAVMTTRAPSWPGASRQLLSGIARCAVCEAPIQSGGTRNGRRRYRCAQKGGHAYREAAPVDEYVSALAVARLARPDAVELLAAPSSVDVAETRREIGALNVRRDAIAEGFADGSVSLSQFKAANNKLAARLAEIEASMPTQMPSALADLTLARDPQGVWETLNDDARRQVIDALMVVRLAPVGTKERAYLDVKARIVDPETIPIEWKS